MPIKNVPDYYLKPFDEARDEFFWAILAFSVKKTGANIEAIKQALIKLNLKANEIYNNCEDLMAAVAIDSGQP